MARVSPSTSGVVGRQDVVALGNQALAQMRAQEPGTAGDENPLGHNAHGIARLTPAPPQFAPRTLRRAADAEIRETRHGHLLRLVDVAQVDHQRARQQIPDAAQIEPAELVPFGQQDQPSAPSIV